MPVSESKAVPILWGICLVVLLTLLPIGVVIQFAALMLLAGALCAGAPGGCMCEALEVTGVYSLLVWFGFMGALLSLNKLTKKEVRFRSLAISALGWDVLAVACGGVGFCCCCVLLPAAHPGIGFVFSIFLFILIAYIIKRTSKKS